MRWRIGIFGVKRTNQEDLSLVVSIEGWSAATRLEHRNAFSA